MMGVEAIEGERERDIEGEGGGEGGWRCGV